MTELYTPNVVYDIRWIQNFLKEKHMPEITETKPLTKHISAAVNAIQKEIDKRGIYLERLIAKAKQAEEDAESLRESIHGLREQISKLKGE